VSRWLVVLVVASGCDFVLGLTHLGPRSATEDKGHVAGTYHQHWIENDQFDTVVTGMRGAPLAQLTATVVLDDGGTRDVTWLDSENFAFTIEEPGDH
jgi:hypothetical protein